MCVLLLAGCSARFAYNNATWLVHWYLDDYVELTNAQEDQFDAMFLTWLSWHKSQELPKYQAHLKEIINDVKNNNINQQSISSHRERARQHWATVRAHVAADIVILATTLSDEQVNYLLAKLEKDNQEAVDEQLEMSELSDDERRKKWIKRNQKNIKRWLGRLNDEQKLFIGLFQDRFANASQHWVKYKRDYQQQLRAVFAMPSRGPIFKQSLYTLINEPEKFRSAQFQAVMQQNNDTSSEYIMGLIALTSEKQIKNLVEEIDEVRQDVVNLQK